MINNFGEKVKEIRKQAGLNQDEFAKELGYILLKWCIFLSLHILHFIYKSFQKLSYKVCSLKHNIF